MSTEDTLEKGYKALFESIQYVIDNSVTVEQYEDNSNEIKPPLVSVNCMPLRRIAPNADFYESECNFICMTYIEDDKSRAILKALYGEIFDYISGLAPATLATETGLQIDGLVMDEQGDMERDEKWQLITVKTKTYLTK